MISRKKMDLFVIYRSNLTYYIFSRLYLSKLLTIIGIGRDMTRAPLMAQSVPTSLPSPVTGYISPYLNT